MKQALVVIGNFDGVHRGHQSVLAAANRHAAKHDLVPRLMTFHPHPAVTLGRRAPPMLTRLERKLELARRACPDIDPALIEFTEAFARQTPAEFVEDVLRDQLGARAVMVGANFRFGRGRGGDLRTLQHLGSGAGFDVIPTDLEEDADGPLSSTRVRQLIAAGDLSGAQHILGRPHMLSGVVSRGDQRGRQLGFPTCNIADAPEALPPFGVYAVLVDRVDEAGDSTLVKAMAKGVANLGVRPTLERGEQPILEVHAFDFNEDVYGASLRVHLVERLRDEQKFDGLAALKTQIARDSEEARNVLAEHAPCEPIGGAWS